MFQKILLPVDGSAQSRRATEVAIDLAKKYAGSVTALCIYRHYSPLEASLSMTRGDVPAQSPDDAMRAHAREIASEAKAALIAAGVDEVAAHAKRGHPARSIVEFADENGFDVIVLGARGAGDATGFFLGSVSHKVAGLARTTCLIVK